jgi:hypothetical protein
MGHQESRSCQWAQGCLPPDQGEEPEASLALAPQGH